MDTLYGWNGLLLAWDMSQLSRVLVTNTILWTIDPMRSSRIEIIWCFCYFSKDFFQKCFCEFLRKCYYKHFKSFCVGLVHILRWLEQTWELYCWVPEAFLLICPVPHQIAEYLRQTMNCEAIIQPQSTVNWWKMAFMMFFNDDICNHYLYFLISSRPYIIDSSILSACLPCFQ